jgi:hypothetical protein
LRLLKERADTYLHERNLPPSNYEDVYFLAWQLAEEASLSRLNPALAPFFEEIKSASVEWVQPLPLTGEEFTFERLTSEACHFIECVVRTKLWSRSQPTGFDLILDLARQFAAPGFTIATLNHDTLIERALSDGGIGFADGFHPPDGDVAFFDPLLLDSPEGIKLLKLHGSIDWRWTRVKEKAAWRDCYTKVVSGEPWQRRTLSGIKIEYELPAGVLVGTMNKLFDYHFGITQEVLLRFHRTLRETDTLVVSGYGWGDFAVNGWLKNWLGASPGHRIVLLHRNPEAAVRDHAGSHIFPWEYDGWVRDGRLIRIQKWLCETALGEILPWVKAGLAT